MYYFFLCMLACRYERVFIKRAAFWLGQGVLTASASMSSAFVLPHTYAIYLLHSCICCIVAVLYWCSVIFLFTKWSQIKKTCSNIWCTTWDRWLLFCTLTQYFAKDSVVNLFQWLFCKKFFMNLWISNSRYVHNNSMFGHTVTLRVRLYFFRPSGSITV